MTDKNLTEIIAIVDRSGSMSSVRDDAIGGFNAFLLDQQTSNVGLCLLTYIQFDHIYEVVHNGIDIRDMKPLNHNTYVPRGGTALLDAIGTAVNTVGERLAKTPEDDRPGNVIVVILTDGAENQSEEYTGAQIKELVDRQTKKYNWGFIYLSQNIDAATSGANIGLYQSNPNVFLGSVQGGGAAVNAAYCVASAAASSRRMKSVCSASMDWSRDEKDIYSKGLEVDNSTKPSDSSSK